MSENQSPTSDEIAEALEALQAWVAEADREGGCTAWGPKFDAALDAARLLSSEKLDSVDKIQRDAYEKAADICRARAGEANYQALVARHSGDENAYAWECVATQLHNVAIEIERLRKGESDVDAGAE